MTINKAKLKKLDIYPLDDSTLEDRLKELLNETYEPYKMGQLTFYAGDILKDVDPIAFREELNNWIDAELGETLIEVDGDYFDKYEVYAVIEIEE